MPKRYSSSVYVFKVSLQRRKKIWRRIALRGSQTLDDLHEAIYDAFDRYDEHLYSFFFPKPGAFGRNLRKDADEYTHPDYVEDEMFCDENVRNAAKARLASLSLAVGQRILYLFDFGDEWWHDLLVEATDAPVEKGRYPRVLAQAGKSPEQYPDFDED